MLFVGERPQQNCASEASTSPSGQLCDEVGGCQARSAPAMFAPPICRRSGRNASR